MMLSGQVPFQGASGQGGQSQAAEIMCKIREGRFSLDGEAWEGVSEEAKELVRGVELEVTGYGWGGGGHGVVMGQGVPPGQVSRWGACRGGEWGCPLWGAASTRGPLTLPRPASRAPDCGSRQAAEARGAAGQLMAAGRQRALLASAADAGRAGVLGVRCALRAQRHLHGEGRGLILGAGPPEGDSAESCQIEVRGVQTRDLRRP